MQPTIHSQLEYTQITEMHESLRQRLSEVNKGLGRVDSLGSAILSLVVGESYERAREEMVAYIDLKSSFPLFQERAQRYVQHCSELIQAIETKRNFPGLGTLSMSKQQEIHEKVLEHFDELKTHLNQIERVEREAKLNDVRSTVWVVRAASTCVFVILVAAFLIEVNGGLFDTFWNVTDSFVDQGLNWFFAKTGL